MKLCFTPSAWDDYLWFQEHDRKLLKRINLYDTGYPALPIRRHWQA